MTYAEMRSELWKAFSDGGEIEWIKDVDLLGEIATAYSLIRLVKEWAEYESSYALTTRTSWSKEEKERRWGLFLGYIEGARIQIVKAIDEIEKHISVERKPYL